jgi:hypothetical protein
MMTADPHSDSLELVSILSYFLHHVSESSTRIICNVLICCKSSE